MRAQCFATVLSSTLGLFSSLASAQSLTTTFSYQGKLQISGSPANGLHDFRIRLYDAASLGAPVGAVICLNNVAVSQGIFTASLDFGAVFAGQQRFLEIEVRADTGLDCASGSGFVLLSPRQTLTATPNALFALSATQFNGQPPSYYQNAANLTTGTLSASRLPVPMALSGSSNGGVLVGQNSSTADASSGIFGEATGAIGQNAGVWGVSHSSAGRGVTGIADATGGFTVGVYGRSMSLTGGVGLFGEAAGATGSNAGVLGITASTGGSGIIGTSTATSGVTYGGLFENNSTSGGGLKADATAESGATFGVAGYSSSDQGIGVLGKSGSPTGNTFGGDFVSDSDSGVGVHGKVGAATPSVFGVNGVLGEATATTGLATGGRFTSESTSGRGVVGSANAASGFTYGVQGFAGSTDGRAIFGYATSLTGATFAGNFVDNSSAGTGVYAEANSPTGVTYAGHFMCGSPNGFAGYFVGTKNYFSGRVGIGTTAPVQSLHVAGTQSALTLQSSASTSYAWTEYATNARAWHTGVGGTAVPNGLNGKFYIHDSTLNQTRLVIDTAGKVGIGTATPNGTLTVASAGLATYSESSAVSGSGVYGVATGSAVSVGVRGRSDSTSGIGVAGAASADTGFAVGVWGTSDSVTGEGVRGEAAATSGFAIGVVGRSNSPAGFDFYADGVGGNYGASSSRRWKRNVELIPEPLAMLDRIRGVYYDWDREHGGHHDVGMIAEEVGSVLPEIVQYERNGVDAIGMDYGKVTPLLVESVKALRAEKDADIEALRQENLELRSQLTEMLRRMKALETLIKQSPH